MIKLRNLLKESAWDRKFGEPLPTFSGVMEKHQNKPIKEKKISNILFIIFPFSIMF